MQQPQSMRRDAHEVNDESIAKALEIAEAYAHKHSRMLPVSVRWDYEGVMSAARLAVAEAIQTYDPSKRASFATWATRNVHFAIFTECRKQQPGLFHAKERSAKQGGAGYGSAPIVMRPHELSPLEMDGMSIPKRERLLNDTAPSPEDEVILADEKYRLHDSVRRALRRLRPEQRQIIRMRFFKLMSLKDISKEIGCSKESVRVREMRAIQRLRGSSALADWATP